MRGYSCPEEQEAYEQGLAEKEAEMLEIEGCAAEQEARAQNTESEGGQMIPEEARAQCNIELKDLIWEVLNGDDLDKWMQIRDSTSPDLQGFLDIYEQPVERKTLEILTKAAPIIEKAMREAERERIINYLQENYGNVGTSASRTTAYRIAKKLAIDLALEDLQALKEGK